MLDGQQLAVAFDTPGRQEITVRYWPAGGLIADTPNTELQAAGYPAPPEPGSIVPSDWVELTMTVEVVAAPANVAPQASTISYNVAQDTPLAIAAPGVLANDTDAEGDPLTATLVTKPSNGELNLSADGSFTYKPNVRFSGSDSFAYKANDGTVDSNIATVNITVKPSVNSAPAASDDNYETDQDTPLVVAAPEVLANDTDVDSDPLEATLVSKPANGTVDFNADGSFTYESDANFIGTDVFTYRASDGNLDSGVSKVNIAVIRRTGLIGDFNNDGVLDAVDIDDLTRKAAAAMHPFDPYDLTDDGLVDSEDVNFWAFEAFGTWFGDANLDRKFSSQDLVIILAANKTPATDIHDQHECYATHRGTRVPCAWCHAP